MTTGQQWTLAGWLIGLAAILLGANAFPIQTPWFVLLGVAVSEEAWFLWRGEPTLSQRYWGMPPHAKLVVSILTAIGMAILGAHLFFGFLR